MSVQVLARRRPVFVAAIAVTLAACGGGTAEPTTTAAPATTAEATDGGIVDGPATSDDGILTIGPAPGSGVAMTVNRIEVPDELAGLFDGSVLFSYEVGPSGAEFAEPVPVRFEFTEAELGFDPTEATVLAMVVLEGDDTVEAVSTAVESVDGTVVIDAEISHFSTLSVGLGTMDLFMSVSNTALGADHVSVEVGETFTATVAATKIARGDPDDWTRSSRRIEYPLFLDTGWDIEFGFETTDPVVFDIWDYQTPEEVAGLFHCERPTLGVVEDAVRFVITWEDPPVDPMQLSHGQNINSHGGVDDALAAGFGYGPEPGTTTGPNPPVILRGVMTADVECRVALPPPEPGVDLTGDQENSASEPVAEGEGWPEGDITRVQHRPEEGAHVFIVEFLGATAPLIESDGYNWFWVRVDSTDSVGGDWAAEGSWFGGPEFVQRAMLVGEERQGATLTAEWVDGNTVELTVTFGDAPLGVEAFRIGVGLEGLDGASFWDWADGIPGTE